MKYRVEHYESMAGLFVGVKEEAVKQRLDKRLWGLFIELIQVITILFEDIDEQELLEKIFHNEKVSQIINHILRDDTNQLNKAA
jgi:hypothetical protein